MASDDNRGEFSGDNINAFGKAEWVGQRMGSDPGGNPNKGYLDQCLPTAYMAKGQDVSSKDDFKRGVRGGMSSTRNESLAKRGEGTR
jgi:hypothetical protein